MFLNKCLQKQIGERQRIYGRGSKICIWSIHVHKMNFEKGVVPFLKIRIKIECCWICWSEKNSCERVQCVLAG